MKRRRKKIKQKNIFQAIEEYRKEGKNNKKVNKCTTLKKMEKDEAFFCTSADLILLFNGPGEKMKETYKDDERMRMKMMKKSKMQNFAQKCRYEYTFYASFKCPSLCGHLNDLPSFIKLLFITFAEEKKMQKTP